MPTGEDDVPHVSNLLLRSLPPTTLAGLMPRLHPVALPQGRILSRADAPLDDVHFIDLGLVSLIKTMGDGRAIEIAAIGIEGMTNPGAIFGNDVALFETVVQVPGRAHRIGRTALIEAADRDPALRNALARHARFAVGQLAQTSACNCLHSIEQRCSRWLLLCHDNAGANDFRLTHEFLAAMLGVRRSGVTLAANALRDAGLIDYERGHVRIVDRAGLEAAACECYGDGRRALEELYGAGEPVLRAAT